MKTQLPKILQAIESTGGEYFQPTVTTPRGQVTITWRHCGNFDGTIIVFDNHRKKPHLLSFYKEGGRRFSVNKESAPMYLTRGIRRYLKVC